MDKAAAKDQLAGRNWPVSVSTNTYGSVTGSYFEN